jgi:hypothetical protein
MVGLLDLVDDLIPSSVTLDDAALLKLVQCPEHTASRQPCLGCNGFDVRPCLSLVAGIVSKLQQD